MDFQVVKGRAQLQQKVAGPETTKLHDGGEKYVDDNFNFLKQQLTCLKSEHGQHHMTNKFCTFCKNKNKDQK
jgi:hypothetical protein